MTPLQQESRFSPATETVEAVRELLQRMGLHTTAANARSLAEAVLSLEGPRLQAHLREMFENSLEIIRDTAESALGAAKERRVERSDLLGGGRRPIAPPRTFEPPDEDLDGDEPRPVFKRPRR